MNFRPCRSAGCDEEWRDNSRKRKSAALCRIWAIVFLEFFFYSFHAKGNRCTAAFASARVVGRDVARER